MLNVAPISITIQWWVLNLTCLHWARPVTKNIGYLFIASVKSKKVLVLLTPAAAMSGPNITVE